MNIHLNPSCKKVCLILLVFRGVFFHIKSSACSPNGLLLSSGWKQQLACARRLHKHVVMKPVQGVHFKLISKAQRNVSAKETSSSIPLQLITCSRSIPFCCCWLWVLMTSKNCSCVYCATFVFLVWPNRDVPVTLFTRTIVSITSSVLTLHLFCWWFIMNNVSEHWW